MKQEQITQFLDGLNLDSQRKLLIRSLINAILDNTVEANQIATDNDAGVIKTGYKSNGKNYPLLVDSEGRAYVAVPWTDTNTTYNKATDTTLGLVKIGYTQNGKNYPILLDANDKAYVNVPWVDTNTVYNLVGANGTTGLIKNGSAVTSIDGYTPCPIINGIPYYKESAAPASAAPASAAHASAEPAVAVLERDN